MQKILTTIILLCLPALANAGAQHRETGGLRGEIGDNDTSASKWLEQPAQISPVMGYQFQFGTGGWKTVGQSSSLGLGIHGLLPFGAGMADPDLFILPISTIAPGLGPPETGTYSNYESSNEGYSTTECLGLIGAGAVTFYVAVTWRFHGGEIRLSSGG